MRPHRWQPTRLPRPWDSPGKDTGVGCHFLLQYMKVKNESKDVQSCPTLSDPMDCSLPGSSIHRVFQARVLEWGAIAFSNLHTGTHIYTYTHINTKINRNMNIYTYIYIPTHINIHLYTFLYTCTPAHISFSGYSDSKESAYNAGDQGLIPGSQRYPGEGNGNPLHYSWLENSMDRGAWRATVPEITKSRTRLSD